MFGFGQEIRRPSTQELTRDRQICKGNVLSRRKSIEQVAKEELGRLVLPDIHKTCSSDTSCPRYEQTRTKGFIRRGYTFDLNKLKTGKSNSLSSDEDNSIEKLLSLKSLDSFNTDGKNENHYFGKYWNPRSSSEESEDKREASSRGDNDSGFSDSSANQEDPSNSEKQHKDRKFNDKNIKYERENDLRGYITQQRRSSFPDVPCRRDDLPSRLVVRKALQVDTTASMSTQSMNSLSTDLAMFKDAFSKGLKETRVDRTKTPHWLLKIVCEKDKTLSHVVDDSRLSESNTRPSPTRSQSVSSISAAADSSFAVFKRKRKNLLSRSQKSRESRSSSESPLSSPGVEVKDLRISPTPSQPSVTEINTHETCCRKKSVASETVDGCCTWVSPPRVQVSIKDDIRSNKNSLRSKKKEVKMPTKYYDCYTPVTSKVVEFSAEKGTDRTPFKIDSKVATMQRALAEFKERKPPKILQNRQLTRKDQSVFSNPEISPRKNTPIKAASHEWPPQMKLSDDEDEAEERPSLSGNGETSWSVNSKCDEWMNRWIQGNHGDDSQER